MANGGRRAFVAVTLLAVSAAMVYGTWLAVDDMRAKPMVAQVAVTNGVVQIVNGNDFTWANVAVAINGTYKSAPVPGEVAPGGTLDLPLSAFADDQGRRPGPGHPVREVAARATRLSRFPAFNVNRPTSGRWPLD